MSVSSWEIAELHARASADEFDRFVEDVCNGVAPECVLRRGGIEFFGDEMVREVLGGWRSANADALASLLDAATMLRLDRGLLGVEELDGFMRAARRLQESLVNAVEDALT